MNRCTTSMNLLTSARRFRRLALAGLLLPATTLLAGEPEVVDHCESCHSDRRFLVENRKLYEYQQRWEGSIHRQAGIHCADCHGGHPEAPDKETAHAGAGLDSAAIGSPTHFRNIPETCAGCHPEPAEGYRQSRHFQLLQDTQADRPGPNCVTCHGSVNVSVLRLTAIGRVCAQCHDPEKGPHPEVPKRAGTLLDELYSCEVLQRTLIYRSDPAQLEAWLKRIRPLREGLARTWHTFDLDKVAQATEQLRQELRQAARATRAPRQP